MKKEIAKLDGLIAKFIEIVQKYPSEYYSAALQELKNQRAELVAKIGKKK